jgi:hypothetical protein
MGKKQPHSLRAFAIAVLLGGFSIQAFSQISFVHDWAIRYNGGNVDSPSDICTDVRGNIYSTGYFEDSINMDAIPSDRELLSHGLRDGYINKLDSSENPIWSLAIGGSGIDFCQYIAYDGGSSLYVSGAFTGTVDFDPGPGVFNLTSAGIYDAFLIKLDTNGVFNWAVSWGTWAADIGRQIAIGTNSDVYIIGDYGAANFDLDPGSGIQLTTLNGSGTFIVKLTSSGNFVWGGDYTASYFASIALDGNGFVYLAGSCQGFSCEMNPGTASNIYSTANNSYDAYLIKMTTNGSYVWHRTIGGTGIDHAQALGVDINDNIFLSGVFSGNVDFDPGSGSFMMNAGFDLDGFICRIDAAGNFINAINLASTTTDMQNCLVLQDSDGYFHLMGSFNDTVDFDPGPLTYPLVSQYLGLDIYYVSFDSAFNFQWASAMEGFGNQNARAFCLDPFGNLISTHPLNGEIDCDLGAGTDSLFEFSSVDIFVTRMRRTIPLNTGIGTNPLTDLRVYPNPSSSVIHISFDHPQTANAIRVYNIHGAEVNVFWTAAQDEIVLSINQLPAGVYFVVCESEGEPFTHKIIVTKD